jgi:hypothetical protein
MWHAWGRGMVHTMFSVRKSNRKMPHGRHKQRSDNNTKINLKEIGRGPGGGGCGRDKYGLGQ